MCLIIAKKAGLDMPPKEHFKEAWKRNDDGFGMAIKETGNPEVTITKGYMTEKEAMQAIEKTDNPKSKHILFHFRVATDGKVCPENCHPFPVTGDLAQMQETNLVTDIAVAHNGVLSGMNNTEPTETLKKEKIRTWVDGKWVETEGLPAATGLKLKYSDTQVFIRDYLHGCGKTILRKPFQRVLNKYVPGRFAFLSSRGIHLTGGFVEDKGIFYSNSSYKPIVTTIYQAGGKQGGHYEYSGYNTGFYSNTLLKCDICDFFYPIANVTQKEDAVTCKFCATQLACGYDC